MNEDDLFEGAIKKRIGTAVDTSELEGRIEVHRGQPAFKCAAGELALHKVPLPK